MKKTTLFLVSFLIYQTTSFAQEYKKDSIYNFAWDAINEIYINNGRDFYVYNNGGTLETNIVTKYKDRGVFTNVRQEVKTYNSDNILIEKIKQNWADDVWVNISKESYTVNTEGKTELYEYFIYQNNIWVLFSRITYHLNSSGNVLAKVTEELDHTSGDLINTEKISYEYYSSGLVEAEVIEIWRDYLSDWENDEKFIYYYNADTTTNKIEQEIWTTSDTWSLFKQNEFNYNSAGLKSQQNEQIRHTNEWRNTKILNYNYDANNNLTEFIVQNCNFIRNTCENSGRHSYTYTSFNEVEDYIFEVWNDSSSSWRINFKHTTYWSEATAFALSTEKNIFKKNNLQIFPNPANSSFRINSSIILENASLKLYNTLGRLVKTIPIKSSQNINIAELPKGVYFLKLETNDKKIEKTYKLLKK